MEANEFFEKLSKIDPRAKGLSLETRLDLLEIEVHALSKEIKKLDKDMEDFVDKYGLTK